jgi:hypothetical protein
MLAGLAMSAATLVRWSGHGPRPLLANVFMRLGANPGTEVVAKPSAAVAAVPLGGRLVRILTDLPDTLTIAFGSAGPILVPLALATLTAGLIRDRRQKPFLLACAMVWSGFPLLFYGMFPVLGRDMGAVRHIYQIYCLVPLVLIGAAAVQAWAARPARALGVGLGTVVAALALGGELDVVRSYVWRAPPPPATSALAFRTWGSNVPFDAGTKAAGYVLRKAMAVAATRSVEPLGYMARPGSERAARWLPLVEAEDISLRNGVDFYAGARLNQASLALGEGLAPAGGLGLVRSGRLDRWRPECGDAEFCVELGESPAPTIYGIRDQGGNTLWRVLVPPETSRLLPDGTYAAQDLETRFDAEYGDLRHYSGLAAGNAFRNSAATRP